MNIKEETGKYRLITLFKSIYTFFNLRANIY